MKNMSKKVIRYNRISTIQQNLDRQQQKNHEYDMVFEDRCSGTIPLFERPYGKEIKSVIESGEVGVISIHSIDRLARNLKDLLGLIDFFHLHGVCVSIENLGLKTLVEGKMNYTIKMLISVMGGFAEIENEIRKERQFEGIELAKMKGVYKNRKQRGKEPIMKFLTKHEKPLQLLQKGYKASEVSKICGIHPNTLTKIKKIVELV
jgi:DNA invertase Pin-like site-specific DNA recombinase